jgi:hypothetical protein
MSDKHPLPAPFMPRTCPAEKECFASGSSQSWPPSEAINTLMHKESRQGRCWERRRKWASIICQHSCKGWHPRKGAPAGQLLVERVFKQKIQSEKGPGQPGELRPHSPVSFTLQMAPARAARIASSDMRSPGTSPSVWRAALRTCSGQPSVSQMHFQG